MEPSFSSGSPLLGGTAQMAASMGSTPEIGQQSPSSVGFVPSLQVPQQPPMPNHHLMAAMQRRQGNPIKEANQTMSNLNYLGVAPHPLSQQVQQTGQLPPAQMNAAGGSAKMPASEAEMILKALTGHLSHRQNMEKMMAERLVPDLNPVNNV